MQTVLIVLGLQHGCRENPLYDILQVFDYEVTNNTHTEITGK